MYFARVFLLPQLRSWDEVALLLYMALISSSESMEKNPDLDSLGRSTFHRMHDIFNRKEMKERNFELGDWYEFKVVTSLMESV